MKLLPSLLASILVIGSFASPASACLYPPTAEDTETVAQTHVRTIPKLSRRTTEKYVRSTWRR